MVPHADAADRPRAPPPRARLRRRARRGPVAIDPQAHDRLVAMTSHVPHVLANVVVNQAGAARVEGHEPLANAGGSLRDMTRIAGANPRIWVDIFLDNADGVRERARRAPPPDRAGRGRARPAATRASSRAGSARRRGNRRRMLDERVRRRRRAAPRARPRPRPARACSQAITQALGAERINIEDFELAARLARARRHADAARHRRGRGAARRRAAREPGLRRRRLAVLDERLSRSRRRSTATSPSRRQVDLAPRAADRRALRGRDARPRLRALRRHRVDARRRARARRARSTRRTSTTLVVHGVGLRGLRRRRPIDCGNAGTLAAAAHRDPRGPDGRFELVGDESLSRRPMERVAEPLRRMGAHDRDDRRSCRPCDRRRASCSAIDYELPVASAQVKSAILLAGLGASGPTTVIEPAPTRDHTELMLARRGRARRAHGPRP